MLVPFDRGDEGEPLERGMLKRNLTKSLIERLGPNLFVYGVM